VGSTIAHPTALRRAGRVFDGWLPTAPSAEAFAGGFAQVREAARAAGRPAGAIAGAAYLTVCLDADPRAAQARLAEYVERYYGLPFAALRRVQGLFAGTVAAAAAWLRAYARAGAAHFVLRAPDLEAEIDDLATLAAMLRGAS
jgi:alkanesulfonate monooxygenase SsuD/methylene tetrahydromethanopterin reductase-like flavin-dependent oxidoreductase (luciferase family)